MQIVTAGVIKPRGHKFVCVPEKADPSHVGYPFSIKAQFVVNFPVSVAQQIAAEELNRWMFAYFAGTTGEQIARQCLAQLGYTVWPGSPYVEVNLNALDPLSLAYPAIRKPDIAVKPPGSPIWEFVEIKPSMFGAGTALRGDQIEKDVIIEKYGYRGIVGPVIGPSDPTNVRLFRVFYSMVL